MPKPEFPLHKAHGFRYLDEGPASSTSSRPPIVLLHGMMGDLSNWSDTVRALASDGYRVLAPILPVYDLPLRRTSVQGLVDHVSGFVEALDLAPIILVGNSLGGQVALFYVLDHSQSVSAMVLSGASGIYERRMGTSTMRRKDRDFIRERAAVTFHDPVHVTDELVDEMYALVNDRPRAIRLIKMARSSKDATVTDRLSSIQTPTLLIWGRDDEITPPDVAHEFEQHLPDVRLHFIDQCGHAPMLEHPDAFNTYMRAFLDEVLEPSDVAPSPEAP